MNITLIIPTMNKPDLLLRLVGYYHSLGFRGKILIGDSSTAEISARIANSLAPYSDILDCRYYYIPEKLPCAVINTLNREISTDYAVYIADDDFLVPNAISGCIGFLDTHHDYVAAHGIGVLIGSHTGDANTIESASFYRQPILEEATASRRFCSHLQNNTVSHFSVHRTEIWRKIFENTPEPSRHPRCSDKTFGDEMLQCGLSAVYGKIKQLDQLYLVRQIHSARYRQSEWLDWIINENWYPSYVYFRDHVAKAISHVDGISLVEAEHIVERAFFNYLKQRIIVAETKPGGIREYAWESPYLRSVWRKLRALVGKFQPTRVILENLLSPASPYHKDFMPIYSAVMQSAVKIDRE